MSICMIVLAATGSIGTTKSGIAESLTTASGMAGAISGSLAGAALTGGATVSGSRWEECSWRRCNGGRNGCHGRSRVGWCLLGAATVSMFAGRSGEPSSAPMGTPGTAGKPVVMDNSVGLSAASPFATSITTRISDG